MEPWRAGSDHNAVKALFGDIFLNALLTGFRAGILDISSKNDIFESGALRGDFPAIDCSGDVQPAMADIDAYSRTFAMNGGFFHFRIQGSQKVNPTGSAGLFPLDGSGQDGGEVHHLHSDFIFQKRIFHSAPQVYLAFWARGHQEVAPGFFCLP
jgi:hypothetical protein